MTTAIAVRVTMSEAIDLLHVYVARGNVAVLIRGLSGTGKSSRLTAFGREYQDRDPDFGCCYANAANMGFTDWGGWPRTGDGMVASTRLPLLFQPQPGMGLRGAFPALAEATDSNHLTELLDDHTAMSLPRYSRGLLIVDEASKAPEECKPSITMLAEEARTGEWGVPRDGWTRVFIANGTDNGSGDTEFNTAFFNKVVTLEITSGLEDFLPHWQAIGLHPDFLNFARHNPAEVFISSTPPAGSPFCTGRSWTEAWRDVMAYCENMGVPHAQDDDGNDIKWPCYRADILPIVDATDDDPDMQRHTRLITAMIAGRVGLGTASLFVEYVLAARDAPSYDDVILDPLNAPIPVNPAVQFNVVETLVHSFNVHDTNLIAQYITRPEFPKALAALFVQKAMETQRTATMKSNDFYALTRKLGVSAQMALYEDREAA